MSRKLTLVALTLVATGCFRAELPALDSLPAEPLDFPHGRYQSLRAGGWEIMRVDPGNSLVQIKIGKGGRLKRLGHNHIVSTSQVGGLAARRDSIFEASLFIPVAELVVDDQALRDAGGPDYVSTVDEDDREGTRANMLSDKVLDAREHPFLRASLSQARLGSTEPQSISMNFRVRDSERMLITRATLEFRGRRVVIAGSLRMTHEELGLEPFSILGGAVAVAEEIVVDYRLTFAPVLTDAI